MAFRWGDYVKVEGSDWMDNFNLAKNGNPIQRGKEEQIIHHSSALCQVWRFQIFSSHFEPLVPDVCCINITFSVCLMAGFSSLPICLRIRTSIWRPLVIAITYTQKKLTLRWEVCIPEALSLINPHRKIKVSGEVSITE